jgi:phospholipase C
MRSVLQMRCALVVMFCTCAGCVLSACANAVVSAPPGQPRIARPSRVVASPITHVVILIMENRSFNYMFMGYPNAHTVSSGILHTGQSVRLQQIPLEAIGDLGHAHPDFTAAYDGGKMDGFDLESWDPRLPQLAPYSHAPRVEVEPDWVIAQRYTIADEMFQSMTGNSYPAHQYLIAGQSDYAIGLPNSPGVWGCDSPPGTTVPVLNANGKMVPGPFPCFDYETLGDLLDAANIPWRYYTQTPTYTWNAYDAISHIRYGNDWTKNIYTPSTQFNTDVDSGILAPVTWLVPPDVNSDHSGNKSSTGPSYVASVVNAIGTSKFYGSTALFIVWDDWGGWYDDVAPPQLDRMGLGFRVPMLVVSAWARHGYVSHVQHEFGSILHFTEENFGLASLLQTDARADDLSDCFDYTQNPPPFVPIEAPVSFDQLKALAAADRAPPDQ